MSEHTLKPCPYALDGAVYQDCPRDVHGLEGERCSDCVAEYRRGYVAAIADVRRFLAELPDASDERIACHLIELRELLGERFA